MEKLKLEYLTGRVVNDLEFLFSGGVGVVAVNEARQGHYQSAALLGILAAGIGANAYFNRKKLKFTYEFCSNATKEMARVGKRVDTACKKVNNLVDYLIRQDKKK